MNDTESREPIESDQPDRRGKSLAAILMPKWTRWILGAVGVGMLAVSAYGVIRSDNELGTVAVVVVGSVFLATGSMGRWPSRLSWGDKSVEWYENVLGNVLATASPETREEVGEIVESTPPPSPEVRWRGLLLPTPDRMHWDAQRLNALASQARHEAISDDIQRLSRLVPDGATLSAPAAGAGRSIDAQIAPRGERDRSRAVGVSVQTGDTLIGISDSGRPIRRAIDLRQVQSASDQLIRQGFGAALIVVTDHTSFAQDDVEDQSRHFVIDLEDEQFATATISQALDLVRTAP